MTVMIKSWNGELVPARVGMVIASSPKGTLMICRTRHDRVFCVDDELTEFAFFPEQCTMISCPFAVGDEVIEPIHFSDGGINYRTKILDEHDLEYINGPVYLCEYRHANPNLRTKPE